MKLFIYALLISSIFLASCTHVGVGVGGTVSGGSSGNIHGGVGVGIHLLTDDTSAQ